MKTVIRPWIVTTEHGLKQALDASATVIYIEKPLYTSIIGKVKKSNAGKLMEGSGGWACLGGLALITNPIGWAMILGGITIAALGNSIDSLKNYSVEIDEVSGRVMLYRDTGKKRYKASKHEISNRKQNHHSD